MTSRISKTLAAGSVGYLAGLLLEYGVETVTGLDFVDGIMAVGGSAIAIYGVNRDMLRTAQQTMREMFGKDPLELSQGEWQQYKQAYPRMAEKLEKALQI